jgi:hypothetical protein
MSLDFPSSPSDGQVYNNFYYDSATGAWRSLASAYAPNYLKNATFTTTTTAGVPLTAQGVTSQSGNLQEWKNSSGTTLSSVDSSGNIRAAKIGLGGLSPNASFALDSTGRFKLRSDGSNSSGAWITDSAGTETAFFGASGTSSSDPIGVYHNGAWRFQVNSSGKISMPHQPVFWAYKTATQSSLGDVVYDVAQTNIGSHYNSSTGRFTAPVAGTYLFFSNTIGANTASTTRLYFKKNNVFFPTSATQHRTANTSNFSTASEYTFIFTLAAGDYVNLYLSESTLYGEGNPYSIFGGYLIG